MELHFNPRTFPFRFPSTSHSSNPRFLSFSKPRFPLSLASPSNNDNTNTNTPRLTKWDLMELQVGRLIHEDPNLTLAKIMARKLNPNVSYLDVEKSFIENKGKLDDATMRFIESVELLVEEKPSSSIPAEKEPNVRLLRPVYKSGVQKPSLKSKQAPSLVLRKPGAGVEDDVESEKVLVYKKGVQKPLPKSKEAPRLVLRRPGAGVEDNVELDKVVVRPNLVLKMRRGSGEKVSDAVLLRKKPEIGGMVVDFGEERRERRVADDAKRVGLNEMLRSKPKLNLNYGTSKVDDSLEISKGSGEELSDVVLLKKPEIGEMPLGTDGKTMEKRVVNGDVKNLNLNEMLQRKPKLKLNDGNTEEDDSLDADEDSIEDLSDVVVLKKPEIVEMPLDSGEERMEKRVVDGNGKSLNLNEMLQSKPKLNLNGSNIEVDDSLDAGEDSGEELRDAVLLEKPEIVNVPLDSGEERMEKRVVGGDVKSLNLNEILRSKPKLNLNGSNTEVDDSLDIGKGYPEELSGTVLLNKPVIVDMADKESMAMSKPKMDYADNSDVAVNADNVDAISKTSEIDDDLDTGLQPPEQSSGNEANDVEASSTTLEEKPVTFSSNVYKQASLVGKPQRIDSAYDVGHVISAGQKELEDNDWEMAERLFRNGGRTDVQVISCSGFGFAASFGSLIGSLPYRNLGARCKFIAFESWLRKKGLDPSLYRQNLGILRSDHIENKKLVTKSSKNQGMDQKDEETFIKFEDLLGEYNQAKTKFLSSFIGQYIKVSISHVERKHRKLTFSGRPRETEEAVKKKISLMAKLNVGDVVKCCITKITYYGIFVEVEGVPALVHQSEVSWDATLDPSLVYKTGQVVEAKVHQLDYILRRITLSLKEPDQLLEALESFVGSGESLEASQADNMWPDVDSLIGQLQLIDGVKKVSKGRFFLSPGLAPTFQVYMGSMFDEQYKLLARYGNKVQEVLVQASLDKEQMREAIFTCANRVE